MDVIRLGVCDTGTGIDEETRERVFEPFFTTKPDGMGTGLGLATVHGMVTKVGGWVSVESEVGVGTCIYVYLPRHDADPEDAGPPEDRARTTHSETILLVEDEDAVRRYSARTLRRAGYTVLESPDGPSALEVCRDHGEPIDLILTDVVMPGMTGNELVEKAKFLRPQARVLFMSGYAGEALPIVGKLLAKPFRSSELLRQVRSSLGS